MSFIDNFLNQITMYRLVLYYLIFLLVVAFIFCFLGYLHFDPINLLFSTLFLVGVCWGTNKLFGKVFEAPTNIESVYISALILALIISPVNFPPKDISEIGFLFWAGVLTMASKYILAIGHKHIFNPVAIAMVLTGYVLNQTPTWWIGTEVMTPFSLLGFLVVRKIRRFDLVFYFFLVSLGTILVFSFMKGEDLLVSLQKTFLETPIFFFAFVMLTEPLTTPPVKSLQSLYGALVGFLFVPQLRLGSFNTTYELALSIGNFFSYLVSPKQKLLLTLKERMQLSPDIYDFVFSSNKKLNFNPGQYLEWTLGHKSPDSRGNRRYFTIASSPTESEIIMGIKFYSNSSSYKKALLSLNQGAPVVASQLAGDFTLPKDRNKKLVFIAGGIGITPFRSMLKYLVDKNEKRTITQFFTNKVASEIVYADVFNQAAKQLGIHTIYTLTGETPVNWLGEKGRLTPEMIKKYVPDYKERTYFLSGPRSMVVGFEKTLHSMGIPGTQIKIDYFPGFA